MDEEKFVHLSSIKRTSPYMTMSEYTALITARALQLQQDAEPCIQTNTFMDPIVIATREVSERRVPLVVRRHLEDGTIEDWYLKDMIIPRT